MSNIYIFLVVILFSLVIQAETVGKLKFAAIFVRHGARSPLISIPNLDKFTDWPMGLGEITPSGERQLFLLGHMFRKYYIDQENFLSKAYDSSELHVISTDYRRTIMSASSLAYGLYPDLLTKLTQAQMIDESIWTPPFPLTIPKEVKQELGMSALPFDAPVIPAVGLNISYDKFLSFATCPKYYNYWDLYFESDNFTLLWKKHQVMLDTICELFALNCTSYKNDNVYYLMDYIMASRFEGYLREFAILDDLRVEIEDFYYEMVKGVLTHNDLWMQSITFNQFSNIIPNYMESAMGSNSTSPKMVILTSHDIVLMAYLIGLRTQVSSLIKTPYASFISIELRKNETKAENPYYVNITLNGKHFRIEGYNEFKEFIQKKGKLDRPWEEECKIEKVIPSQTIPHLGLYASGSIIAFLIIGIIILKKPKLQSQ